VLTKSQPWEKRSGTPRRAALSAFGFGGINAHVLVEEWQPREPIFIPTRSTQPWEGEAPAEPVRMARQVPRPPEPAPIAIVGMGACFGKWHNLRAFQERVLGRDDEAPPEAPRNWWGVTAGEWFRKRFGDAEASAGYYLHELEFPLDRFRIPPKE